MWDEGENLSGDIGHWEVMRSTVYTDVSCGFSWTANGEVMMTQDFFNTPATCSPSCTTCGGSDGCSPNPCVCDSGNETAETVTPSASPSASSSATHSKSASATHSKTASATHSKTASATHSKTHSPSPTHNSSKASGAKAFSGSSVVTAGPAIGIFAAFGAIGAIFHFRNPIRAKYQMYAKGSSETSKVDVDQATTTTTPPLPGISLVIIPQAV